MIDRLPYPDERENPDPRGDLDQQLEVTEWTVPSRRQPYADAEVPDGAPSWWHGDEEASQNFLREMGVNPRQLEGGDA